MEDIKDTVENYSQLYRKMEEMKEIIRYEAKRRIDNKEKDGYKLYGEIYRTIIIDKELREYQKEAVESLIRNKKGIVLMPTGTGKSLVAIECMRRLRKRTIIIVPTEAYLKQWQRKEFLGGKGLNIGEFYGRNHDYKYKDVVISIYNSVANNLWILENFDFIVFDEAHHLGAEKFSKILGVINKKEYVLGLTSVIERPDGMHNLILQFLPVIYEMRLSYARERGWISELKINKYGVDLTVGERFEYDSYTETIKKFYRIFGFMEISDMLKINHPLARAALSAIVKRKMLLSSAVNKRKAIAELLERFKNDIIILFSESIDSIKMVKKLLESIGYVCGKDFGIYHSKMKVKERNDMLERFRRKEFKILLSVRCLEEGIDVPDASIGIIIGSGRTKRQSIQRLGRIMRKSEKKFKEMWVVYCKYTIEEQIPRRLEWLLLR